MANWCINKIEVWGKANSLCLLKDKLVKLQETQTHKITEELLDGSFIENSDFQDYEAFVRFWDSSIKDWDITIENSRMLVEMYSAWIPIADWIVSVCNKYQVECKMYFEELQQDYAGLTKIDEAGKKTTETYEYAHGKYLLDRFNFKRYLELELKDNILFRGENATSEIDKKFSFLSAEELSHIHQQIR